ncbi:ATP-binding protein [bacterium]|nr:ATP-binding protein [bacterium]
MYSRLLNPLKDSNYFLFGPRGTGKSSWVQKELKGATYIDLLKDDVYRALLARPETLSDYIPNQKSVVVIDEVQKIPKLLDEVHRLIENKKHQFVLTGSSARKLKKQGINLLAGRAHKYSMYPLSAKEMGKDFDLLKALKFGMLPMAATTASPKKYLESYVTTYLKEEIEQEGLTRNISSFARFLEVASFSQASILSTAQIATEAQINRKVVEDYFSILRDLMLSYELPVFSKKAKRELMTKRKFYFFDVGVYRTLRPRGPLDIDSEMMGPAFETLCVQELMAINHYLDLNYEFYHWRTRVHQEVDLVLYGKNGFIAMEFKSGSRLRDTDFTGLALFAEDYPQARRILVYGGREKKTHRGIELIPAVDFFKETERILSNK